MSGWARKTGDGQPDSYFPGKKTDLSVADLLKKTPFVTVPIIQTESQHRHISCSNLMNAIPKKYITKTRLKHSSHLVGQ